MGGKLVLDQSTDPKPVSENDNYSYSLGSRILTNIIITVIVIFKTTAIANYFSVSATQK